MFFQSQNCNSKCAARIISSKSDSKMLSCSVDKQNYETFRKVAKSQLVCLPYLHLHFALVKPETCRINIVICYDCITLLFSLPASRHLTSGVFSFFPLFLLRHRHATQIQPRSTCGIHLNPLGHKVSLFLFCIGCLRCVSLNCSRGVVSHFLDQS